MIQRVQSVYLLLAIILVGSLFFVPFSEMTNSKGELFILDAKGLYSAVNPGSSIIFANTIVLLVCAACIALMITTLFRFKALLRQIKLARLSLLMLFILAGVIFYEIYKSVGILGGSYSLKIFASFPFISLILIWLAIRGMKKDDHLLKSIDRIR